VKIYLHDSTACIDGTTPIRAQNPIEYHSALKLIRNSLLLDSDWTQVSDCQLDEDTKRQWREWRQYLRDVSTVELEELSEGSYELQDSPSKGRPLWWATYSVQILPPEEDHVHGPNEEPHSH